MNQNIERLQEELKALGREYRSIIKRFKYVTLPFMKTRVPQDKQDKGFPDNNEVFHLLTAFIEEFFDQCPRLCTYLTITGLSYGAAFSLYG